MIKTVIIDDEPRNIKLIAKIIRDHCPAFEVTATTDNLANVFSLVHEVKPSLLVLDIEFPSGTIFSILEKLPVNQFQVIFITAHNTYAAEAFKQNAVDYILKPVTKEALIQAMERARIKIQDSASIDISKLIATLRSGLTHSKKIPLPSSDGILFVDEMDIIRCEASGRYTIIYLKNKTKLTVTRTLKEIEALLTAKQFFRIHHSHIINLDLVKKYHRGQGGMIELTDGSFVDVSSSRKDGLLDILMYRNEL